MKLHFVILAHYNTAGHGICSTIPLLECALDPSEPNLNASLREMLVLYYYNEARR